MGERVEEQVRKVWVVHTNTDLTEGRGREMALAVCELQATALRLAKGKYVQGSDCPVRQADLRQINGAWYAPMHMVNIQAPTKEDLAAQELMDRKAMAIEKARSVGLTEEDIKAMTR